MILARPSHNNLEQSQTVNTCLASRVSPWLAKYSYLLGRKVVLPFFFNRIEVTGQENVPLDGPVIVAPTHRSRWDAILVAHGIGRGVSGRDLRFMVSRDEVKGIQGWFIKRLGGFPIDSKRPAISSIRHGVELLLQKEMLVIFPEGTIYRSNQVRPLKSGLARIALQAEALQSGIGAKILPISLSYNQAYPGWGCDAKIEIGSPLNVADYLGTSHKKSAKLLMQDLESALKNLHEPEFSPQCLAISPAT